MCLVTKFWKAFSSSWENPVSYRRRAWEGEVDGWVPKRAARAATVPTRAKMVKSLDLFEVLGCVEAVYYMKLSEVMRESLLLSKFTAPIYSSVLG